MRLVSDVRDLWRRWSTRIAGIQVVTASAFWVMIPHDLRDAVPEWFKFCIVITLGALFIGAQSVAQPGLRKDDK